MNAVGGHHNQRMGARIDPTSFRRYFDEHYGFVCRVAEGIVYDRTTAEDVAQDTFISLYRNPPRDPEQSIRGWLTVVAVNTALNYLRRDKARTRRETGAFEMDGRATLQEAPLDELSKKEDAEVVKQTLRSLEDRERAVLVMRSAGLSYREIARAVDVKEASVGTIIARARLSLRAAYARLGGSDDDVL